MRHTVSALCVVLALSACGKGEVKKKDCIDPVTYANICVEQAIREEEAKSSSYLDMKYGAEDKAKEVALAPAPVQAGPVSAPVQQAAAPPRAHSSFIFLPMFLPSSSPAPQTFNYSRPAPVRPVQPYQPSVAARMATATAKPFTAPVKPFLPSRPAPTIQRPVQPAKPFIPTSRPVVPSSPSKAPVRVIPIVPSAPKPTVTPTVAPKPSWSAPKVTVSPSRPSVPSYRPSSSGRR